DTNVTPHVVRFQIDPGPRFVFEKPRLILLPDDSAREHLRDALHRIKAGEKYSSGTILDVETALLERLKEHGYPSPVARAKKIIADHATHKVDVSFTIDTGPAASFGSTKILGLEDVSDQVVVAELAWEEGSPYDRRKVDKTREQLIRTGLFRSVRIDADHPEGTTAVNINLTLLEAPHRSVRAGLWYYSDLGLGTNAGWTHRNIFGAGQELRLDAQHQVLFGPFHRPVVINEPTGTILRAFTQTSNRESIFQAYTAQRDNAYLQPTVQALYAHRVLVPADVQPTLLPTAQTLSVWMHVTDRRSLWTGLSLPRIPRRQPG
ncbi:MAG: hypothetical protein EOM17_13780, partial [Synergistales bacterium]|nr:hypothetical protein [Synergistales bacterium]